MTTEKQTVTDRWFLAFDDLVQTGRTNIKRMADELDTDRRNFYKQAADHSRAIIKHEWLTHLVLHYGLSADWLLTGRGWPWGS